MKLTKETLKRIIKEELSSVLNEVHTGPDFEHTNIPLKFKDKFLDLVHGGELDQAQVLVDSFEGDPEWIKKYTEFLDDPSSHPAIAMGKEKAPQPVIGSRFPWKSGNLPSFGDVWNQLTGQSPYQMIQKSIEQDERRKFEDIMDGYSRHLQYTEMEELRKWWDEKINASKRELALMDSGWDHYEVMKSRNKRLFNIRPKPQL
jgi:hypothetical protein